MKTLTLLAALALDGRPGGRVRHRLLRHPHAVPTAVHAPATQECGTQGCAAPASGRAAGRHRVGDRRRLRGRRLLAVFLSHPAHEPLATPLPLSRCNPRFVIHGFLLAGAGSAGPLLAINLIS